MASETTQTPPRGSFNRLRMLRPTASADQFCLWLVHLNNGLCRLKPAALTGGGEPLPRCRAPLSVDGEGLWTMGGLTAERGVGVRREIAAPVGASSQ